MSYRQRQPAYRRRLPERPRRGGRGCLAFLVVAIWVALALVLAYQYWLRPQVSRQIGEQIGERLGSGPPGRTEGPGEAPPEGAAPGALQTAIAALPEGELRVTEEQANAYLAANADQMRPIEAIAVRFVPGEVQADITAFGATSTARSGLAIQAGRVIAVGPRLDGPLENIVDLPELIGPLEQQLNEQLAAQGRRVTDVRVEQGAIVLQVASAG